ncbi:aspartate aminotransferase [Aureibacter tunicatorum]|nr:aspartate aminotransferase [Aureibacter tunicatorum]
MKIASISHRSNEFQEIYKHTSEQLKNLLSLPEGFKIFFLSSATEVWERTAQNLIKDSSLHIVNGAFSKKSYDAALKSGVKNAQMIESEWGAFPNLDSANVEFEPEVINVVYNETSTGVKADMESVYAMKNKYADSLLMVDVVSAAPVIDLDYNIVDSIYFSVQKCFGLPSGLGVWIVNEKCLARGKEIELTGTHVSAYHSLSSMEKQAENYQTPETPNMLGIYLLGRIAQDMNEKSLDLISNETKYKNIIISNAIKASKCLELSVRSEKLRSDTVIVTDIIDEVVFGDLSDELKKRKLVVGSGYGQQKGKQIRIANFPTHSKEHAMMLSDIIEKY